MKNSFKSLFCALALGTTTAFAGPGDIHAKPTTFESGIYQNLDGALVVNLHKSNLASAEVIIKDANGDILAREGVGRRQQKACTKFNLDALRDGEYQLEISSKDEKTVRDFTINSETAVTKRALTFE